MAPLVMSETLISVHAAAHESSVLFVRLLDNVHNLREQPFSVYEAVFT